MASRQSPVEAAEWQAAVHQQQYWRPRGGGGCECTYERHIRTDKKADNPGANENPGVFIYPGLVLTYLYGLFFIVEE